LCIGAHRLGSNALLAPMAGITDGPLRRIAARFGAGMVVSEMIASAGLATGQELMVRKLERSGDLPHMVQLAGCEPRWMEEGARLAVDAGADILDINFGCPAKRVTNGLAGSALMREPDQALRIVESVLGAAGGRPVTVKMRLGWDDDSLNAPDIAARAVAAGVSMITVHGRTRQQFYKGSARWDAVRAVVEAVPVPVVVNGDITDVAAARTALARSGAAAVMIGRGAQGKPWIVGQIGAALAGRPVRPAPTGAALADLIAEHYEAMLSSYGAEIGLRVARKHLGWYADALPGPLAKPRRRALVESESPAEVLAAIPRTFGDALSLAA
jgi:tRNA-dihydrouridine synthase B